MNEQTYINGFNRGYLIAKHEPGLVGKMIKTLQPTNDFLAGFFNGKEEWEIEHSRVQLDELKQVRDQSKDRDLDRDM